MLNWDSVARRYVEHDVEPAETFGELPRFRPEAACTPADFHSSGGELPPPSAWTPFGAIPAANDNPVPKWRPRGDYISTYGGRFWPEDPRPEDVRIEDIAHSLAMQTRYGGHCLRFYSIAEHSVHLSRYVAAPFKLAALLHDAPEALTGFGDVPRPAKTKEVREREDRVWRLAVAPRFGLAAEIPHEVHEADSRIIADEMRQNMHECDPKFCRPLGIRLEFWSPGVAEIYFLDAFRRLTREAA